MLEPTNKRLLELLSKEDINAAALDNLANQLVWRIGRLSDDAPLTIRVGLASSIALFNDLPKLRSPSEAEIEAAVRENDIRVEWVGRMPG